MSNFKFSVDDTKIQKSLAGLYKGVRNFRKPLEEAGEEMLKIYSDKNFKQQGALGEKWKPLSAATLLARKNRTGHYAKPPKATGKILIWTGALMSGFFKNVTKTRITIANNVDYFKYHQKRGGKPAQRRMLYLNKDIIRLVVEKVDKHVKRSIK